MGTTTAHGDRRAAARAGSAKGADGHRFSRTLKDARAGILEAQYQVGLMYANGAGTRRDLAHAIEWIARAAERGHVGAQFMLGTHYAAEPGAVPDDQVDEAQALEWLLRAARQGHARAHHRLARLLGQSHAALAAAYEATAASLGVPESQMAVALSTMRATDEPELLDGAVAWLRRAAAQGLPTAQTELGNAYIAGRGVAADRDEGLRWLRAAAAQQWPSAVLALHRLGADAPHGDEPPADSVARNATRRSSRTGAAASRRPDALRTSAGIAAAPPDPVEAQARYDLAQLWELGLAGLPRDLGRARHWYALAAEQGLAAAHAALARLAESADPEAAIGHLRRGADAGDATAQAALGRRLSQPDQSAARQLEGLSWTARAAQAGQPQALLELARCWQDKNPELAAEALRRAAEAGAPEAQYRYAAARLAEKSTSAAREAFAWNRRAADQGHAGAWCALGVAFASGNGVARDVASARDCLRHAADRGAPSARWHLALMLAAGDEQTPRDVQRALGLCRKAADDGFVAARATMGVLCSTIGQHEDAARWWQQAAERGDVEAQFNLAQALAAGRGVAADSRAAFELFVQAAEAGLVAAQARVGILYASGNGVVADPIEAHKWFYIAKLAGDGDAARNLRRSRGLLGEDARGEAERRARAWLAARPQA